jgi:hypothetical protein
MNEASERPTASRRRLESATAEAEYDPGRGGGGIMSQVSIERPDRDARMIVGNTACSDRRRREGKLLGRR